jgi:hypothetical protein
MSLPRPLSEPGPVLAYLSRLREKNPKLADDTILDVRAILQTPGGAILLDLLEKSTLLAPLPVMSEERALAARNAQAILALDLRRITSDEHEQVSGQNSVANPRRTGR